MAVSSGQEGDTFQPGEAAAFRSWTGTYRIGVRTGKVLVAGITLREFLDRAERGDIDLAMKNPAESIAYVRQQAQPCDLDAIGVVIRVDLCLALPIGAVFHVPAMALERLDAPPVN
jgi:hypothetical protein